MPRRDATGPAGMGPATGWGMGPCGRGLARGRGFGGGTGYGYGGRRFPNRAETKEMLEQEAEDLKADLKAVEDELKEYEK